MRHTTSVMARWSMLMLLCFAVSGTRLLAQTTYTYSGQSFTTADPPYTTSNRVSGSFKLPLPLPPSLSMAEISGHILDFSFLDGVQTRTPTNTTVCTFQVTTDTSGNILDWLLSLRQAPTPAVGSPQQFLDSGSFGDQVGEGPAGVPCGTIVPTVVASTPGVGSWASDQVPGSGLTYQFFGNPFTSIMAPYTTSDRVTGSIDLGSPLPPFLPLTEIGFFLQSFTFQDGVQTRTAANTFACAFQVATNGSGNIVDWRVFLRQVPLPALGNPQQFLDSTAALDFVGEAPVDTGICETLTGGIVAESSAPGSWNSPLPPGDPSIYEYVGESFTAANPPWVVGQNITGSLLLSDELPANLPLTDISLVLLDFTFQDGVQVRTPGTTSVCDLRVATDANGEIVDWFVVLRQAPTPTPGQPQQFLDSTGPDDQAGEGLAGLFDCDSISPATVASTTSAGTWSGRIPGGPAAIPTLSSVALAALGLTLAMAASWVLKRKRAPSKV